MFNENVVGYCYDDISIRPSDRSYVRHRSECTTMVNNDLPIFTAPMSTVVDDRNYSLFDNSHIMPILPRNTDRSTRDLFMLNGKWVAYSLSEFEEIINTYDRFDAIPHILIDVANGNMDIIFRLCETAKSKYGKENIVLMAGNIANPKTYELYCKYGIDYVRCGIGGGCGCFHSDTEITTNNGKKRICDIKVGDYVLTHTGAFKEVVNTVENYEENSLVVINGEVRCTNNHKFYVIDKDDKDLVNDGNISDYAHWVKAEDLDREKHLLKKGCLSEIHSIETVPYIGYVYDITVDGDHSYVANGYCVHNCITSSNTGIHYGIVNLLSEIYAIKKRYQIEGNKATTTKIVADGGVRKYADVIKALALGADYVMVGSEFSRLVESCAKTYTYDEIGNVIYIDPLEKNVSVTENCGRFEVYCHNEGQFETKLNKCVYDKLYKTFYGMASKKGQKDLFGKKKWTSEGIEKRLECTTNIDKWSRNMNDYLSSAMSYCNIDNISDFNPDNVDTFLMSQNLVRSINK